MYVGICLQPRILGLVNLCDDADWLSALIGKRFDRVIWRIVGAVITSDHCFTPLVSMSVERLNCSGIECFAAVLRRAF